MFVEVRAKNITADRKTESRGGSMWVNDPDFEIALRAGRERHLNDSLWYLELKGASNEQQGGDFSFRETDRRMTLQLTPSDLAKILHFALAHKLLDVRPTSRRVRRTK